MLLRFALPSGMAPVLPGQFFMLRAANHNDPLIGRAFALYDLEPTDGQRPPSWADVVYVVKGKLTQHLALLKSGDEVAWWGPLGNGFSDAPTEHLVMVAGGIGQTPFFALAKEALGLQAFSQNGSRQHGYATRATLCYGARSAEYLAGVDAFRSTGMLTLTATDDGSLGPPKLVTDLLREVLGEAATQTSDSSSNEQHASSRTPVRLVCCGPEGMMEAVTKIAIEHDLPCEVSLETPMACGIGICFSCVAKVGSADDWDYKRTCVEGPVFDARTIQWT
jgi:dihydroorotate dehydrogenase electron transfer subunit